MWLQVQKMKRKCPPELTPPHALEYFVWTMTRSGGDGQAVGKRLVQGDIKETLWCSSYLRGVFEGNKAGWSTKESSSNP